MKGLSLSVKVFNRQWQPGTESIFFCRKIEKKKRNPHTCASHKSDDFSREIRACAVRGTQTQNISARVICTYHLTTEVLVIALTYAIILTSSVWNFKRLFGYLNDIKWKNFNYKVVDLVDGYNFDIKFVHIQLRIKIL